MNSTELKVQGNYVMRNVRRLLVQSGISIEQLAELSGVSKDTLRRIERKRRDKKVYLPTLRTVHKLAQLTGTTVDEFAKGLLTFQ